jgi:hypothetical protein
MNSPLAKDTSRLAPTTRTAKEDLKNRTGDHGLLRPSIG